MFHISKLSLLVICSVCLIGRCSSSESSGDQACLDIVNVKETIQWVGLMATRFILMTSQGNVFDLDPGVLDHEKHRLYLSGSQPRSKIYPVLEKKIKQDGTGFFLGSIKRLAVMDQDGEYLYVENYDLTFANVYDITRKRTMYYKVNDQQQPASADNPQVALSSNQALQFYLLNFDGNDDRAGMIQKVAFLSGAHLSDATNLQAIGSQYYICISSESVDQVYMTTDSCDLRLAWGVTQGFVDSYNFYLIAANRTVLVFSTSAYSSPGTAVKMYLIQYSDFFVCQAADEQKSNNISKAINDNLIYIIIGIVLLLAIIGIFAYCCMFSILCCCCSRHSQQGAAESKDQQQQQSQQTPQLYALLPNDPQPQQPNEPSGNQSRPSKSPRSATTVSANKKMRTASGGANRSNSKKRNSTSSTKRTRKNGKKKKTKKVAKIKHHK